MTELNTLTDGRGAVTEVILVRRWSEHFETYESRKLKGALSWVKVPVKHDGRGLARIMKEPDGLQIFGAWILILQIAAKMPVRGLLAKSDGALAAADIAVKTGCQAEDVARAVSVLAQPRIAWICIGKWDRTASFDVNVTRLSAGGDISERPILRKAKDAAAQEAPNVGLNGTSRLTQWFGGSNGRRR